jgi:two-component system chemotaxis response regulator CheB
MHEIPAGLPAAFLIVQHMPEGFTLSFAERISWESRIKAKEAQDGDVVSTDKIYVAPGGSHLVLEKTVTDKTGNGLMIKLNKNPRVNFVRPSITVTMDSAAQVFCPDVLGVILTGMGKDGLEGAKAIKERGGKIIAQDKATSTIFGMPGAVINSGLADKVLPVNEIAQEIIRTIKGA